MYMLSPDWVPAAKGQCHHHGLKCGAMEESAHSACEDQSSNPPAYTLLAWDTNYMLMRYAEGRKKESNKQGQTNNKAKQHNTPKPDVRRCTAKLILKSSHWMLWIVHI